MSETLQVVFGSLQTFALLAIAGLLLSRRLVGPRGPQGAPGEPGKPGEHATVPAEILDRVRTPRMITLALPDGTRHRAPFGGKDHVAALRGEQGLSIATDEGSTGAA